MRFLIFSLFLISASSGNSQDRLRNVQAVSSGTSVTVSFAVSAGFTCNGYRIWHTTDSTNFYNRLYDNGGAEIGNPTYDEYATPYVHTSPVKNMVNYYRVELEIPHELSEIKRVFVSPDGRSELIFFPNPVSSLEGIVNLRMPGLGEAKLQGFLLNRFGTVSRYLNVDVVEGKATLAVNGIEHGVYILWMSDGWNVFAGKFIVMP